MIDILIADDQPQVCSALRLLLEQQQDWQVVGQVDEAKSLCVELRSLCPSVVLLDWELPGLGSVGGLSALRPLCPTARVLVLSGQPEARQESLNEGADAFVSKGDPPETLLSALHTLCPASKTLELL